MKLQKRKRKMFEEINVKQESRKEKKSESEGEIKVSDKEETEPLAKKPKIVENDENGNDLETVVEDKPKGNDCKLCKKVFASMDELVMHAKIEHTTRKQKTFSVDDIEYFLKVFLKLKKSHCPICHKAILNTLNWRGHMYKHCVTKNISCRVCMKTFTRADHCKNHEARHKVKLEGDYSDED